ncbi:phosphatidylinositol 4-kinase gamma 4-like [Zingiber officinale]|uniref:phosphatidylinositol 4-kinase gamma 4-like n=1 Tax=Zingiber officinale TaxID=94328 RepID=UPI001C4CC5AD|nr:phosphatidylinositol 4-kinase gamma 4-like [Zingiber officinale]
MSSSGVLSLIPNREDSPMFPVRFDGSRSPHCLPESILIYLAVAGSSVIPLRVLESESIASVKLRIQSYRGFAVKKQKLVFDGRELARNNNLVRDYGVGDGHVLHLIIRLSDLRCITVRTISRKTYNFQVERSRNIGYIKLQLAKRGNHLSDIINHKLIYDGEELDDSQLIDDIDKNNDAVIHLLIRGCAQVSTETVEKDFELSIYSADVTEKEEVDDLQIVARNLLYEGLLIKPLYDLKVELSPVITDLIRSAALGLEKGNLPIMSSEGSGGAYFMQDACGHKYVALFKPIDEEPMAENNPRGLPLSTDGEGLKKGTRVGKGAIREVAAYILDHPVSGPRLSDEVGFAGVPPTTMVRCFDHGFHHTEGYHYVPNNFKIGSLQAFVENYGSCEDMGPQAFPVQEVHKICVLDIRLANADRHAGNILICKDEDEGRMMLVPIDHGYCLPENFEDCTFEWLYWPQAHRQFNEATIDYIKSLDAEADIELLKNYGLELASDSECTRTLRISTMLLKKGVERGLTPYEIGSIMCRETVLKESKLEEMIREAKDAVLPGTSEAAFLETLSEIMDHYLVKFDL